MLTVTDNQSADDSASVTIIVLSGDETLVHVADISMALTAKKTKKSGSITFTVTNVSASGCIYDPGSNTETSDSIVK